jgi:uncharacterized protein (DUF1800 family)
MLNSDVRRPRAASFSFLPSFARLIATLAVAGSLSGAPQTDRLADLSTRGQVGTSSNIMITGFVVQAGGSKQVLVRAVGPALAAAPFNLTGTLPDPTLTVYNSSNVVVASNDNWSSADAATMASLGAFALPAGSKDAALVATLAPGNYTAQVTGINNSTGLALLEVYDVSGTSRLMNLSTRALVGSGASMLISGLVVAPSGGIRKVLIRAAGPGLASLGVAGTLADPIFSVIDSSGRTIASNDNWSDADVGGQLTAAFAQSGAFPFANGSKDAALIVDLPPNTGNTSYTIEVSSVNGATGLGLVEVYDLTPSTVTTASVSATSPTTDTNGSAPGVYTFTRLGATTSPLTITYAMSGSAVAGTDYVALPGSVTIPAGSSAATVTLTPIANSNTSNRTATLTITSGLAYTIGTNNTGTVTIFYSSSGTLYVANLRATSASAASTAYGTATLLLSPDGKSAFVNVSFANLSSPEVVAHLEIDGNYVFNLPQGQVTGAEWTFTPTGTYSAADLLAALLAGKVNVEIDTSANPNGELEGGYLKGSGASAFSVPAAPPAIDLSTVSQSDAARFLTQATFGPTTADINTLVQQGYSTWLTNQMAITPTSHRAAVLADFAAYTQTATTTLPVAADRQAAWWKIVVTGQDQLRQRVAFALSEIMVISDQNSTVNSWQEGMGNYYDILAKDAFGNFRQLLNDVTLNPMMGTYLSMLRSAKGTFDAKGNVVTSADENYAREVMQLFTIGLNQLLPDGTLALDPSGQPIPTYNQTTVTETAKVFTGWSFNQTVANPNFRGGNADYITPMMLYPAYHDDFTKTIVGGKIIPANQGGAQDLKDALDTLFNHANTGPFIARRLIQQLVTSNPSPGYVYRVAQVFANDGTGTRGNLGAVVRAILLDYEARSPALLNNPTYGKMKEPLLRGTELLRAFGGNSNSGRFNISNPEANLGEASLRANTVFNFFQPDYIQPGPLAANGLYAPEYQLLTDTTAITIPNFLYTYIYNARSATNTVDQTIGLDLTTALTLVKTPQSLLDNLKLVLTGGTLSAATNTRILAAINGMPNGTSDTEKVRTSIYLMMTSPDGAIQK